MCCTGYTFATETKPITCEEKRHLKEGQTLWAVNMRAETVNEYLITRKGNKHKKCRKVFSHPNNYGKIQILDRLKLAFFYTEKAAHQYLKEQQEACVKHKKEQEIQKKTGALCMYLWHSAGEDEIDAVYKALGVELVEPESLHSFSEVKKVKT